MHDGNATLHINAAFQTEQLRFYMDGRTTDICALGVAVDSEGNLYHATNYQVIKATPRL